MSALVNEDDLMEWTGYEQRSMIEKFLKRNRISYDFGKGNKLVTTQTAIDKGLSGSTSDPDSLAEEF